MYKHILILCMVLICCWAMGQSGAVDTLYSGGKQQDIHLRTVLFGTLIPVIVFFLFLVFVLYRSRREAAFRQREFDLQLAKSNMEMKALRAQVNPHFIFNCLGSIQHYISRNNNERAQYYLTRFSQLIRLILENSTQNMITLQEDIEVLKIYVEMEQMRIDKSFVFNVNLPDHLDPEKICLPPLLVQPVIENAIWHGIHLIEGAGEINVDFHLSGEILTCTVDDNGGQSKNPLPMPAFKKKSLGLSLIKERLDLLNDIYNTNCRITISDRLTEQNGYIGKRTIMEIPCEIDP